MAKEVELQSDVYQMFKVAPGAAGAVGEVLPFNEVTGFLIEPITAAEVVLGEERALMTKANITLVQKTLAQVWTAGQALYFDPATSLFTTVRGILQCSGYVFEAAAAAATEGQMVFMGTPLANNGQRMQSGLATFTGTVAGIDTGLTLIVEALVTVKATAQAAGALAYATYDHGADGLLDIYGWDDAGAGAANAGTVAWMVLGS